MTYEYYINLDERGDFYADVRDNDETFFEIHGHEIFENGFMSDKNDTDGLQEYLVSLGVIEAGSNIILAN